MATRAREVRDIRHAASNAPNCATCARRTDRRYPDEVWEAAKARYEADGSARVVIRPLR